MHRILIIDDLQSIHDDFRKILVRSDGPSAALAGAKAALFGTVPTRRNTATGFEVDHALQGEDGLLKVQAGVAEGKRYKVAFVDMRMPPGWNGLQTIQRLWEADADLQVVICTAYSDQSWEEISSTLGLTDRLLILKKPFDPVEVLQLATALSEKWNLKHQATLKLDELEQLVEQRTAQLAHDSLHDGLTRLPNRAMLRRQLGRMIEQSQDPSPVGFTVFFLDFDRFKVVNDSLGHDAGDELLIEIARRLSECIRCPEFTSRCAEAMAARLGGDEFVVIAGGTKAADDPTQMGKLLLEHLAVPYTLKGYTLTTTASIGITTEQMGYSDADQAIRDADTAMYHAKAAGKAQYVMFDSRMHEEVKQRLTLENELRGVAERGELILHYQPVICLSTGKLSGFEALVRWNHPTRGMVPPGEFISAAEETGQIVPIGLWVLREACRQLGSWQRTHPMAAGLVMSVNVSARQLVCAQFVDQVLAAIRDAGIEPGLIALEITETAVITDPETATSIMKKLRGLGVRLYMDDFGTGYSSLSYLHHLPINSLKMDRSFMASVSERREYAAVVFAIVTLARNLGISVIAEGVEKEEQVAMLQSMECDLAQGFLFSRPVPVLQAEEFMLRQVAPKLAA